MARPPLLGEKKVDTQVGIPPALLPFFLQVGNDRGLELAAFLVMAATQYIAKMPFDVLGEDKSIIFDEMSPKQKEEAGKAILDKLGIKVRDGRMIRG